MKSDFKTRNGISEQFKTALLKWNELSRQQQDSLCKSKLTELAYERKELIGILSDNVYNHKTGYFSQSEISAQQKMLKHLADNIRNWLFREITDNILINCNKEKISKVEKRRLLIDKLWCIRPEKTKNEILHKSWNELNSDEIIWIPGLICLVYQLPDNVWQKATEKRRTKLISQLENCIRQDKISQIVAQNLCKIRRAIALWSQYDIARMIGTNQNVISRIESGINTRSNFIYDLFYLYSQHVSLDGIFSEEFSVNKITISKKRNAELIQSQCNRMFVDGMQLMRTFLIDHIKTIHNLTQTNIGKTNNDVASLFEWLYNTEFTSEQILIMQQAVNENNLSLIIDK